MTTEEKFNAAVNVIRNLPKNGAYQPSHDLMLKFYSYFKQATEGPCNDPKPAFWEVVKKAKWSAWSKLGNMSKEEAMINYVDELKKIVETMSYTENVANFIGSLDSFYESIPVQDLELIVGPVLERIRAQADSSLSGSSVGSRETSPIRKKENNQIIGNSLGTSTESINSLNTHQTENETEDEYIDTESVPASFQQKYFKSYNHDVKSDLMNGTYVNGENNYSNYNSVSDYNSDKLIMNGNLHSSFDSVQLKSDFIDKIAITLKSLQKDLDQVKIKIANVEEQVLISTKNRSNQGRKKLSRWPLLDCSPRLLTLIILWPFAVQLFMYLLKRHKHKA